MWSAILETLFICNARWKKTKRLYCWNVQTRQDWESSSWIAGGKR